MTDTITVDIPADVRDNNTHTVRVVSNGTRQTEGGQSAATRLADYKKMQELFGYAVHEFDAEDRDGRRVTLTWFADTQGQLVWLFETSYYTRVECARCAYHWAQAYVVIEQDGESTDPEPLCGDHIDMTRKRVRHARDDAGIELTMHCSEPLRIGQH